MANERLSDGDHIVLTSRQVSCRSRSLALMEISRSMRRHDEQESDRNRAIFPLMMISAARDATWRSVSSLIAST